MSERETLDDLEYGVAQGRYTATQVFEKMRARVEETRAALAVCQLELAGERGRAALATDALDPRTLEAAISRLRVILERETLDKHASRESCLASRNAIDRCISELHRFAPVADEQDCPHAAPFRYCPECAVSPCPIGLGSSTAQTAPADGQAEPVKCEKCEWIAPPSYINPMPRTFWTVWSECSKAEYDRHIAHPSSTVKVRALYARPTPQADEPECTCDQLRAPCALHDGLNGETDMDLYPPTPQADERATLERAVTDAALNLCDHMGCFGFRVPVPNTTPPLYVSMGMTEEEQ